MSICDPALRTALRTLKLSGMLDTLDARLAQTRDGGLGHLEFLQALCQDEIARRESAALTRRLRRAKFEEQATFEDFDFTANPKLPAAMLRDLAALRWLDAGESVILYGPVGVGKTHVAQALGHHVARRGGDIRFVKCARMLADLELLGKDLAPLSRIKRKLLALAASEGEEYLLRSLYFYLN